MLNSGVGKPEETGLPNSMRLLKGKNIFKLPEIIGGDYVSRPDVADTSAKFWIDSSQWRLRLFTSWQGFLISLPRG